MLVLQNFIDSWVLFLNPELIACLSYILYTVGGLYIRLMLNKITNPGRTESNPYTLIFSANFGQQFCWPSLHSPSTELSQIQPLCLPPRVPTADEAQPSDRKTSEVNSHNEKRSSRRESNIMKIGCFHYTPHWRKTIFVPSWLLLPYHKRKNKTTCYKVYTSQ